MPGLILIAGAVLAGVAIAWRAKADLDALEARLLALEDQQRSLGVRQDRLQKLVTDRGWRDSHLLTHFDWRRPEE